MPIIATPENATELTQLRGLRSKVFALANGKRRLITKLGRVHYHDDSNALQDIELATKVEPGTGEIIANRLPYRFRLRTTGVGFNYQSREDGGVVRKALTRVGESNINQNANFNPTVNGNRVRYTNVVNGLDVIFDITRSGVKTYWVPKTTSAPKTVRWAMEYDGEGLGLARISNEIRGLDNLLGEPREGRNRRPLNVSLSDGAATLQASGRYRFFRDETWTGETQIIDPDTRIRSWVNEVIYPVAVDPDITEEIAATADDGYERDTTNAWIDTYTGHYLGKIGGGQYHTGWRFQSVAIPAGSTIDLANLKLRAVNNFGGAWGGGTAYGYDTDNSGAWTSSTRVPSVTAKTSASATITRPTAAGLYTYNVTSLVQEIVDRGGWSSGNNISLFAITYETTARATIFEDFSNSGTDEPTLEIDYTEGGGGSTAAPIFRRRTRRFAQSF